MDVIAGEIGVPKENIVDFDLSLYDVSPSMLVGLHKEFISSPRLDNMFGSTVAARALLEQSATPPTDGSVDMFFAYDHEEVGSKSYQGAAGTITEDVMKRIYNNFLPAGALSNTADEGFKTVMKKSLFLSGDNGHAVHPNYPRSRQEVH